MKRILWLIVLVTAAVKSYAEEAIQQGIRDDIITIASGGIPLDPIDYGIGSLVERSDVQFYGVTKDNPIDTVRIGPNDPSYGGMTFNPKNEYVFIIHGWTGHKYVDWYKGLKDGFLSRMDKNFTIIEVDWWRPARHLYSVAVKNAKFVGGYIGDFVVRLHRDKNIPFENFHLVGHSLGAHVAGFAGKKVQEHDNNIYRITALDPAGPYFRLKFNPADRLSDNDADVVVVVHTDFVFGYIQPIGTLDFYPNGGGDQPGCNEVTSFNDILDQPPLLGCHHSMSHAYYIEALMRPDAFVAVKCDINPGPIKTTVTNCNLDDTVTMGDLNTTKRGNYYLQTNAKKPFGRTYL